MPTDDQLIKGCLKQDRKCQKILLERYSGILMAISIRYNIDRESAKDTLQEAWIKAFNNFHQYEIGTNLRAWLSKILINTALKEKVKNSKYEFFDNSKEIDERGFISPSELEYNDLIKMISHLKSPSKDVFMMYVLDGMSHKEIADVLKIKPSTSRVHLTNARKTLRSILQIVNID